MRLRFCAVLLIAVWMRCAAGAAQAPGGSAAVQEQGTVAALTPAGPAPSAVMQPSLSMLKDTVDGMHTDKWKIPGTLKDETETNLGSIRRDLDGALPGLLATADGAGTVSSMLPAYRNIEALYDVVLRVDAAARMGAPAQQSAALDQVLAKLDEGRRGFGDRLVLSAQAQDKQGSDLQAALKAAQAPVPVPVCPAPAAAAKKPAPKKPAAKPAAKPATPPAN